MNTDSFSRRDTVLALVTALVVALVLMLGSLWLMLDYAREADFLRYRLAQNLHAGEGLVYNPGEDHLLVLHPLSVLPLALDPSAAPDIAAGLSVISTALAGALAYHVLRRAGLSQGESGAALLLWLAGWPLWASWQGPDTIVMLLVLLALDLGLGGRWWLAGLVGGLAALVAPSGLVGIVALGLFALTRPHGGRFWLTAWIAGVVWIGVALLSTDAPFDELIAVGILDAGPFAWPGGLWLGLLVLNGLALSRARLNGLLWWPLLWAALDVGAGLAVHGELVRIESPPLALAVGIAFVLVSRFAPLTLRFTGLATTAAGMVVLLLLAPPRTAPSVAEDIALAQALDLPPQGSIAHDRHDAFTYYASQGGATVHRLDGRYSRPIRRLLDRGDLQSLVVALAPDVLYMDTTETPFDALPAAQAALDTLGYVDHPEELDVRGVRPGDHLLRRGEPVGGFGPTQPVDLVFSDDVHLTGYAVDRRRAGPGTVVRFRLDWNLARLPEDNMDLYLNLIGADAIASDFVRLAPENWATGPVSTYHALRVPDNVPPGVQRLFVTVGYNAATLNQLTVASIVAPLPTYAGPIADEPLGTLGEVSLVGAPVEVTDRTLTATLLWRAERELDVDVQVFVHLIPAGESVPAAQNDSAPRGGNYPTRFWLPGEVVPDEHRLALDGLPAGDYVLRVGLYDPADNTRLSGPSGDSLIVARVSIDDEGAATVQPPE